MRILSKEASGLCSTSFHSHWAFGKEEYCQRAETTTNLIIGGKLAEYKYYDMAPTLEKVMKMF